MTSVCISTPAVTAVRMTPVCSKCAVTKKSGRLSCCAPGGAWFNNCGTSDNSNTDHTWFEGLQACKDVGSLLLVKAESQSIAVNQTTTTQQLNGVEHHVTDPTFPTRNSKDNDKLLHHIVIFTIVLLIMFLNI